MDKDRSEPAKAAVAGQLERGVRPHQPEAKGTMNTDQCPGASVCCNPSWCKTTGKCLHQQPGQQTPAHVAEVLALSSGNVSRRTDVAVRAMDDAIVAAINAAKNAGVPQGLIVGLLHSYAHDQTAALVNGA